MDSRPSDEALLLAVAEGGALTRRRSARVVAVLWAVTVLAAVAGTALTLVARGDLARGDLASNLALSVSVAAYATLGALVVRRVSNAIGWIMLAECSFPAVVFTVAFMFLLFPTGTLPSRRWRPAAAGGLVLAVLTTAGLVVHPRPMTAWSSPSPTTGRGSTPRPPGTAPACRKWPTVWPRSAEPSTSAHSQDMEPSRAANSPCRTWSRTEVRSTGRQSAWRFSRIAPCCSPPPRTQHISSSSERGRRSGVLRVDRYRGVWSARIRPLLSCVSA